MIKIHLRIRRVTLRFKQSRSGATGTRHTHRLTRYQARLYVRRGYYARTRYLYWYYLQRNHHSNINQPARIVECTYHTAVLLCYVVHIIPGMPEEPLPTCVQYRIASLCPLYSVLAGMYHIIPVCTYEYWELIRRERNEAKQKVSMKPSSKRAAQQLRGELEF